MVYKTVQPGQWVCPPLRGWKLACCDCGLVHVINIDVVNHPDRSFVYVQFFRHNRATAAKRRGKKYRRKKR